MKFIDLERQIFYIYFKQGEKNYIYYNPVIINNMQENRDHKNR